jgi:hypothetical protein
MQITYNIPIEETKAYQQGFNQGMAIAVWKISKLFDQAILDVLNNKKIEDRDK